jgi:putative transposase
LKAARRREIAHWLMASYGIGVRHACRLCFLSRASLYYKPRGKEHTELKIRIRDLATTRPRYGYRRLHVLLRREGRVVNHKLVYKLYRAQNLELRLKKRRKRISLQRSCPQKAAEPNQRWSMDFMADRLEDRRRFRLLTLVDHFSRVSPALAAGASLTARHVVEVLERIPKHKLPKVIQVDNGPEFISRALDAWAYRNGVVLDFSRPGKPTDNAVVEAFNARVRAEFLSPNLFMNLEEAKIQLERFRIDYNSCRPHSSLGYLTPAEMEKRFYENKEKMGAGSLT